MGGTGRRIRFGVVSDIHAGPNEGNRRGEAATSLLAHAVDVMAEAGVEFVVELGDRVNNTTPEEDWQRLVEVRHIFDRLPCPVYHLHGNHDVEDIPKDEQNDLLGKRGNYECIQMDGLALILLDTTDIPIESVGGALGAEQLKWFEEQLDALSGDVLVFSHHPLVEQDIRWHSYFVEHPHHAFVQNRDAATRLYESNPKVRALFSGHLHSMFSGVASGRALYTVPSLVDARLTGQPLGAFGIVDVTSAAVQWHVFGKNS